MKPEKTYGVGVVGAGAMGKSHLKNFSRLPGFGIRAVADVNAEAAAEQAAAFGATFHTTDYREVVTRPDIDVVVVAVPAAFHADIAVMAAENGKHVFCEKPLALTVAAGERMIRAAKEADVKLALGFQLRFHKGVQILRERFRNGVLGRPVFYTAHAGLEVRPKLAMHDDALNRGPLVDVMCHTVDLWRGLFESDPVCVYARAAIFAEGKPRVAGVQKLAVDTAVVVVEFASGDVGTFHVSWGLPEGTRSLGGQFIHAPNGHVQLAGWTKITFTLNGREPEVIEDITCDAGFDNAKHFAAAVTDAAAERARRMQEPLPLDSVSTGEDGLMALKVSLAALESAATGRLVSIAEMS